VQAVDPAFAGSPFASGPATSSDPVIQSIIDIPGDQGGNVFITIQAQAFDSAGEENYPISAYNVWRRIDSVPLLTTMEQQSSPVMLENLSHDDLRMGLMNDFELREWNDIVYLTKGPDVSDIAPGFPPGSWAITGSFAAAQQSQYVVASQTMADSTEANGVFWSTFVVTAHTTTPSVWYMSAPDSGYSVDNIAPGVPSNLVANFDGDVNLSWDPAPEPDFQYFRVYRDTDPGFIPGAGNLVHQTAGTGWIDSPEDPGGVYYKVTSVDHAGNESLPATLGSVAAVGDIPTTQFIVSANYPNPFNPSTTISYTIKAAGHLSLKVYNAHGQLVKTLWDANVETSGSISWDGTNNHGSIVSSGVYFYKARMGNDVHVNKMVLLK